MSLVFKLLGAFPSINPLFPQEIELSLISANRTSLLEEMPLPLADAIKQIALAAWSEQETLYGILAQEIRNKWLIHPWQALKHPEAIASLYLAIVTGKGLEEADLTEDSSILLENESIRSEDESVISRDEENIASSNGSVHLQEMGNAPPHVEDAQEEDINQQFPLISAYVRALLTISKEYERKNETTEAVAWAQRVIDLPQDSPAYSPLGRALAYEILGADHLIKSRNQLAAACIKECLPILSHHFGENTQRIAEIWNAFGIALQELGKYHEATKAYLKCQKILSTNECRESSTPEHLKDLEISCLDGLGRCAFKTGDFLEAERFLTQCLALQTEIFEETNSEMLFLHGYLGLIYYKHAMTYLPSVRSPKGPVCMSYLSNCKEHLEKALTCGHIFDEKWNQTFRFIAGLCCFRISGKYCMQDPSALTAAGKHFEGLYELLKSQPSLSFDSQRACSHAYSASFHIKHMGPHSRSRVYSEDNLLEALNALMKLKLWEY